MAEKYRFSPIINAETFQAVLDYITAQTVALAKVVLNQELLIDTLTIFSHFPEEHAFLETQLRSYGPVSSFTHRPTLYIDSDFDVLGYRIKFLGLREPDTTRPQVGYADFPVDDYEAIAAAKHPFIHEIISGRGQSLLELRHPDFDVLGYIVRSEEHNA